MAFNVTLTIRQSSKFSVPGDPTVAPTSDTPDTIKVGILGSARVVPIKHTLGAPATTTWIAFNTNLLKSSGVRADVDFRYEIAGGSPASPTFTALEYFVSTSGGMDKVYANSVATTFAVTAHKEASLTASNVFVEGYIYHRDNLSFDTLLDQFEDEISLVSTQYTHSLSLSMKWDTGEQLVTAYRFRNEGADV